MGEKSVQKKRYIVEKAREVFMEQGYKNVTMKNIVDACEISRGGLYLYFDSTKQLFEEVLKLESEDSDDIFSTAIKKDATAVDILTLFFNEQKKEIMRKNNDLSVATYEYFFENKIPRKDNKMRKQFEIAIKILERLIQTGVDNGELSCEDPLAAARNIMFVIQGLKITAQTFGVTDEAIENEFEYIMQRLYTD